MHAVFNVLVVSDIGIIIWFIFNALRGDRNIVVSIIICAILIIYVLWKGTRSVQEYVKKE